MIYTQNSYITYFLFACLWGAVSLIPGEVYAQRGGPDIVTSSAATSTEENVQENMEGGDTLAEIAAEATGALTDNSQAEIRTEGTSSVTRYAPGEFLPISVKLVNFGFNKRVDVTITYRILAMNREEVFSLTETVAVQTTASFIKQIQIPQSMKFGKYIAVSDILYDFQDVPATSEFQFTVEPKIFGFFRSDFLWYIFITLLVSLAAVGLAHLLLSRRTRGRLSSHEYDQVPKSERIYFEIISDTIGQMRLRVGDDALAIAGSIPDLVIDSDSGRVIAIKKDPSKIVALLVLRYETLLGHKVDVKARGNEPEVKESLKPVESNINMVRKYFE